MGDLRSCGINPFFLSRDLTSFDSLGSAQIMYAYAIRPTLIPKSFYKFIITTGPIPEKTLQLVRKNVDTFEPIDVASAIDVVQRIHKCQNPTMLEAAAALGEFPKTIPCELMHPNQPFCRTQFTSVFKKVFFQILPVRSWRIETYFPLRINDKI
jgi:hypothetical protein